MAGFFAIVGGCTPAKTHGCELWVTKEPLEVDGELHLLRPQHCYVVHAKPTVLVVAIILGKAMITLAVGHAPPSSAQQTRRAGWWADFRAVLREQAVRGHTVVMLDANARVGEPAAAGV
eukprot:2409956-Lingulodinium_polyedra.AAC.1